MRHAFLLVGLALLSACTTTPRPEVSPDGIARGALGQTIYVDGPKVTPLAVLEDSRCPINARCMWAGQVRLSVRVTLGNGDTILEMTSSKPLAVADGTLELVEVTPPREAGAAKEIKPTDYRFGFKFMGGY